MLRHLRLATLPVLLLPGYVVVSSLQACSSSSDEAPQQTSSSLACGADEVAKTVSGQKLCCAPAPSGGSVCHAPGAAAESATCGPVGTKVTGATSVFVTWDVCVSEQCFGDRTCQEFPQIAEERTGDLVCVSEGAVAKWQASGTPSVHRVERACLVTGRERCGGDDYSYSGDDDEAYGYDETYSSSYAYACGYASGNSVAHRELVLVSSTCSAGGAASACPVGAL